MNGYRSVSLCVLSLIIALGEVPMRAAPVAVGALAAGSFGDASGHSAQSHLVYASNAGVWWLFTLTSSADSVGGPTHIVKAYRSSSSDLATAMWTAATDSPGATTSVTSGCVSCFMGGGRALGVAYMNVGGADVIHAEVALAADGQDGLTAHIRATVTATTIAWESWNYHDEPAATWTLPRSVALGVSTGGFIHSAGPTLQQEVDANARKSLHADTSAAWTSGFSSVAVIDNSMPHQNNAFAFAPLASDAMLAVYDNGAGTEPSLTNLRYTRSNADGSWPGVVVGSQNGGDGNVFASDATIDQNDWALVAVGPADIYAFRRNAAGTGVDAAVYAPATNAWSAFPAPPNVAPGQAFPSGAGLFGATDGASVWLFAVGSDAAGTILSTRHDASGWTPWTAVPGTDSGTHVRRYIAGYPRVAANQIGLMWTEGSGPYDVVATSMAAGDSVAPQVAVTAPADGSTVSGPVTIQADASDNVAVAGVTFQIDGAPQGPAQTSAPYQLTWDSTTVPNGTHTIAAVAADAAGNTSSASVTVSVSNQPDTTPPTLTNVTVFSVTATSASISWTTNERATSRVDFGETLAYGAASSDAALTTAHALTMTGLRSGTTYHSLASSADAAGNVGAATDGTFTTPAVDTTPPAVSITAPSNGATVSGTVNVSANATDDTRVAGVQFLLDGANLGGEVTAAPYTIAWTTTTAANGAHALTARARDAAGNQATSAAATVAVANVTPPSVDFVVSADQTNSRTVRTNKFSTTTANELLLALVGAGDAGGANSVTSVSGGGLAWTLVLRTSAQRGTAEIWRAFTAVPLSNVVVQAQLAQGAPASLTIVGVSRVDTSAGNGAAAIGAAASGSAGAGAPSAALVTTRNNSLVFGVGNDGTASAPRSVGSGQTLLHQFLSGSRTAWTQRITSPVAASGTTAIVNDVAPTADRYNLTICEVRGRLQ